MQKADRSFETHKQNLIFLFEYFFDSVTHQVITNSVNLTPKNPPPKTTKPNHKKQTKNKTKQNPRDPQAFTVTRRTCHGVSCLYF